VTEGEAKANIATCHHLITVVRTGLIVPLIKIGINHTTLMTGEVVDTTTKGMGARGTILDEVATCHGEEGVGILTTTRTNQGPIITTTVGIQGTTMVVVVVETITLLSNYLLMATVGLHNNKADDHRMEVGLTTTAEVLPQPTGGGIDVVMIEMVGGVTPHQDIMGTQTLMIGDRLQYLYYQYYNCETSSFVFLSLITCFVKNSNLLLCLCACLLLSGILFDQ